MKKRIGDITLQEFEEFCSDVRLKCDGCPLAVYCNSCDSARFDVEVDFDGTDKD